MFGSPVLNKSYASELCSIIDGFSANIRMNVGSINNHPKIRHEGYGMGRIIKVKSVMEGVTIVGTIIIALIATIYMELFKTFNVKIVRRVVENGKFSRCSAIFVIPAPIVTYKNAINFLIAKAFLNKFLGNVSNNIKNSYDFNMGRTVRR